MIPFPPDGASILSIFAAHGSLGRPMIAFSQGTLTGHLGKIPIGCELDFGKSPRELLLSHTTAPLHLALLEEAPAEAMILKLLHSDPRLKSGTRSLLSTRVRRCPVCVKKDLVDRGFSYSRVLHQLRPVLLCREHGVPLEEQCSRCLQSFFDWTRKSSFPRGLSSCAECGSRSGKPLEAEVSAGYMEFVQLLQEALEGRAPSLLPSARFGALARFSAAALQRSIDPLEFFCRAWSSPDFLSAANMAGSNPEMLRRALRGAIMPMTPFLSIAALSAARLFSKTYGEFRPIENGLLGRSKRVSCDGFTDLLVRRVREFGLQDAAAYALLRGESLEKRCSRRMADYILSTLSHQEMDELGRRQKATRAEDPGVAWEREFQERMMVFAQRARRQNLKKRFGAS